MGKIDWASLGMQAGSQAIGGIMGLIGQGAADRRQIRMQEQLQAMQIKGQKELTDYNTLKQMEMWRNTSYPAQMEMIKTAGLNPALLYGMGGGGGQTANITAGNVSAGNAPSGGGEIMQGLNMGMQLQLLKAQKENIEADTRQKNQSALTGKEQQLQLEYQNILSDMLQNYDMEGNLINPGEDQKRTSFQERVTNIKKNQADTTFRLDENKRAALMNDAAITKIGQEIDNMKKQGQTQDQILKNLETEGKLKELELKWAENGLSKDTLTQFIMKLITR